MIDIDIDIDVDVDVDEIIEKIGDCDRTIEFKTTPAKLLILLSSLQLALQLEENNGASWDITFKIAKDLEKIICEAVPEAQALIELNWNLNYEANRKYFER